MNHFWVFVSMPISFSFHLWYVLILIMCRCMVRLVLVLVSKLGRTQIVSKISLDQQVRKDKAWGAQLTETDMGSRLRTSCHWPWISPTTTTLQLLSTSISKQPIEPTPQSFDTGLLLCLLLICLTTLPSLWVNIAIVVKDGRWQWRSCVLEQFLNRLVSFLIASSGSLDFLYSFSLVRLRKTLEPLHLWLNLQQHSLVKLESGKQQKLWQ